MKIIRFKKKKKKKKKKKHRKHKTLNNKFINTLL